MYNSNLSAKLSLSPHPSPEGHCYVVMLVAWCVWKHRNTIIFNGAQLSLARLLDMTKSEARQWVLTGGKGLAALLPAATESSG